MKSFAFIFAPMKKLARFKQKETRRMFLAIFGGKMLGIGAIFGAMIAVNSFLGGPASAQTATVKHCAIEIVSPVNQIWVLVTAFLVFFMQAGFMALEAGFARSREAVNVLLECVFDTCLCGLLYWAFGFAFQFGSGNGFIGHQYFFLHGMTPAYGSTSVAFLAFWLFQFAFADTASTVTSGAIVGRTSFKGDILYSNMVSRLIYSIFRHCEYGPGGLLQDSRWFLLV